MECLWRQFGCVSGSNSKQPDELGAKLITGSSGWRDCSVDANLLLLGQDGGAGLIVRSSGEEEGVDAYRPHKVDAVARDECEFIPKTGARSVHGRSLRQLIHIT